MFRHAVRTAVAAAVLFALVAGGAVVPAVAAQEEECNDGCVIDPGTDPVVSTGPAFTDVPPASEEAAATVRKAFLKAKKRFHEGRQEIQSIKKGEEDPVENVPTFFEDSEADDTSGDDASAGDS